MTSQAYAAARTAFFCVAALSAHGLFACSSSPTPDTTTGGTGAVGTGGTSKGGTTGTAGKGGTGTGGTGTGGSFGTGGTTGGSSGTPGTGGTVSMAGRGSGGIPGSGGTTGGSSGTPGTGGTTGGSGGMPGTGGTVSTGGTAGSVSAGGSAGMGGMSGTAGTGMVIDGCSNTDTSKINMDASGFVCNNTWGIKGAWYCYSDGSDSSFSCQGSDKKGAGAIPWDATANAMCLKGNMGTGSGAYAGIGFKVNSGKPGDTAAPGTWNASSLAGFAITLGPGSGGKGTGGMILNLEYPTTTDLDSQTKDAPGITVPGVPASGTITYNALFADSVLANNKNNRHPVDPANLTDVKIAFFPDSVSHSYDFCIKSIVPLMTAPNPVVPTGAYGPAWTNQLPQAVNGINGYAVQSAPFPTNGQPMTMQVSATATGVGFSYTPGGGFQSSGGTPGSFPAIISGWGPGHDGIQFYGPYKQAKQISQLTSVKSSWSFSMGSSGDAVYDVWFGNSATPTVPQVELMIWIGNKDKNPIGGTKGNPLNNRQPYTGSNPTGEDVVSYWVAQGTNGSPVTDLDLLAYFKDAVSQNLSGKLSNSSYLLGVQTGFEVYGGNWSTMDYKINIQ